VASVLQLDVREAGMVALAGAADASAQPAATAAAMAPVRRLRKQDFLMALVVPVGPRQT
jgi:hypothetical protein